MTDDTLTNDESHKRAQEALHGGANTNGPTDTGTNNSQEKIDTLRDKRAPQEPHQNNWPHSDPVIDDAQRERAHAALHNEPEEIEPEPTNMKTPDNTEDTRMNKQTPLSRERPEIKRPDMNPEPTPEPPPKKPGNPSANQTSEAPTPEPPSAADDTTEATSDVTLRAPERPTTDNEAEKSTPESDKPSKGDTSGPEHNETLAGIYKAKRQAGKIEDPDKADRKKKHTLLIAGTSLLIIAGISIVGAVSYYSFFTNQEPTPIQVPQDLIAANEQTFVLTSGQERNAFLSALRSQRDKITISTDDSIVVTAPIASKAARSQLSIDTVLPLLAPSAPNRLARSVSTRYTLGIYGTQRSPFIIFNTTAPDLAYSAMLEWESKIYDDLAPYLGLSKNLPRSAKFRDRLVQNKNVRVLTGGGTAFVAYMFIEPEILAIASDIKTLNILVSARQSAQKSVSTKN